MDDLSVTSDLLSEDLTQADLDEWLHTTDVFEQNVELERPAQIVTTTPHVHRPKRRDSFDCLEKDVFGIDVSTALRAPADRKIGAELASDLDQTHHSRRVSVSSLCSKSLSSISPQPVLDLTANESAIIDLTTTDTLPKPPILFKRARKSFDADSSINVDQMLMRMGKPSSSSIAATIPEARGCNLLEKAKSCPPTRRFSVGSTELMSKNWQKKSPRRVSLPGALPPTSRRHSSPSTSFFRHMDEHSTRLQRMISTGSAVSHVGDDMNSMNDSIMSNRSLLSELQDSMAQTQQSRRMIIDALSDSDGKIDVASSAHVDVAAAATAAAVKIDNDVTSGVHVDVSAVKKKMTEFGMQSVRGGVAGLPKPVRNSSNAIRATNNDEMTKTGADKKRYFEVAREKMILEKRLSEMYGGVGNIQ